MPPVATWPITSYLSRRKPGSRMSMGMRLLSSGRAAVRGDGTAGRDATDGLVRPGGSRGGAGLEAVRLLPIRVGVAATDCNPSVPPPGGGNGTRMTRMRPIRADRKEIRKSCRVGRVFEAHHEPLTLRGGPRRLDPPYMKARPRSALLPHGGPAGLGEELA